MVSTIMVGVDGEQDHRAALEWAARRATRDGARLELVYVLEGAWNDGLDEGDSLLVTAADSALSTEAQYATRVADEAAGASPAPVSARYSYGHVGTELAAASRDADLLVLGTPSAATTSSRRDHFVGSLAVRVAATAHCTVAVVPHGWQDSGVGVVVGTGARVASRIGLAFAADEAQALDEPLTIVCSGYTANPLLAGLVPEDSLDDRRSGIVEDAARFARERHPGLVVRSSIVEGPRSRALAAAAGGARMLVVGTHERHGVNRLMLGSVTHDLLLNVRIPTVVARDRDARDAEQSDEEFLEDDG